MFPFLLKGYYLFFSHLVDANQQVQIPIQQHINHLRLPGGASGLIWILVSETICPGDTKIKNMPAEQNNGGGWCWRRDERICGRRRCRSLKLKKEAGAEDE
jgi:hypothetical protein